MGTSPSLSVNRFAPRSIKTLTISVLALYAGHVQRCVAKIARLIRLIRQSRWALPYFA